MRHAIGSHVRVTEPSHPRFGQTGKVVGHGLDSEHEIQFGDELDRLIEECLEADPQTKH